MRKLNISPDGRIKGFWKSNNKPHWEKEESNPDPRLSTYINTSASAHVWHKMGLYINEIYT